MKKNILACIAFLTLWSFNSHAQSESEYSDDEIIRVFSEIGPVHNDGLKYVFDGLRERFGSVYKGGNTSEDHALFYQVVDSLVATFLKQDLKVDEPDWHFVETIISNSNKDNNIAEYGDKSLSDVVINLPEGQNLTKEMISAISQLESLLEDPEVNSKKEVYDELVQTTIRSLSNTKEKEYFAAMASIAYHSLAYWQNHENEWKTFFGGTGETKIESKNTILISSLGISLLKARYTNFFGRGKNIAVADVAGVVVGGVGGCAYGALGGTIVLGPIGTVAGCAGVGTLSALGGGLGNSVKKAVEEFFDWLF